MSLPSGHVSRLGLAAQHPPPPPLFAGRRARGLPASAPPAAPPAAALGTAALAIAAAFSSAVHDRPNRGVAGKFLI